MQDRLALHRGKTPMSELGANAANGPAGGNGNQSALKPRVTHPQCNDILKHGLLPSGSAAPVGLESPDSALNDSYFPTDSLCLLGIAFRNFSQHMGHYGRKTCKLIRECIDLRFARLGYAVVLAVWPHFGLTVGRGNATFLFQAHE